MQPSNAGKGAALRRAFAEAVGEYVVVQDADLEYDPADFDLLLQGRTYAEGKKIRFRDAVHAVSCIVRYSAIGARLQTRALRQ